MGHFNDWVPEAIPKYIMTSGKQRLIAVGKFGGGTLDYFVCRMDEFVKKYKL